MIDMIYSVAEASKVLGVSKNRLYDLLKAGYIPYFKLGSMKIRESALNEFIKNTDYLDYTNAADVQRIEVQQ